MEELQINEEKVSITALTPVQQRFIHLYLTGQYSVASLAQLLGVHPNTCKLWLKKPEVREIVASFQEEEHELVEMQIKAMRNKAIGKMGELMESPIDGVALSACKDILDRSGHRPSQKVEKKVEITSYEKQLQDIMSVVDVEYEEG